jgi:hypothetical protein
MKRMDYCFAAKKRHNMGIKKTEMYQKKLIGKEI